MRLSVFAVALLVLVPPASALLAAPKLDAFAVRSGEDIRDGDLILMLARAKGLEPARLPVVAAPLDLTVPTLVERLAVRAGAPLAPGEADVFLQLDARLAPSVATLLFAVERAWIMRDNAFAHLSDDDIRTLSLALRDGRVDELAMHPVLSPEQEEELVTAAVLLADTLDTLVLPALAVLADAPVWPPIALRDPVGVLNIGSGGNDIDSVDRIVSLDGAGDDTYLNNAGGNGLLADFDPNTKDYPVAVAIDLKGNDRYDHWMPAHPAQGGAQFGLGMLLDYAGADVYRCGGWCLGAAGAAVSYFRDHDGGDNYTTAADTMGVAGLAGIGIARDDRGDDVHSFNAFSYGHSDSNGIALHWDRAGLDAYLVNGEGWSTLGYAAAGGRGWHVEEGADVDTYWRNDRGTPIAGKCNTCVWSAGTGGRGNDNFGGLPYLYAYQQSH